MKQTFFLLTLAALLFACQPQDPVTPQTLNRNASTAEVTSALTDAGGLRIAEFREDGENLTRYFEGYTFTFEENGRVLAERSGDTVEGTYSVFRDDGRVELSMNFPETGEFYELTDDWYFRAGTGSRLEFEDFMGSLIFESN